MKISLKITLCCVLFLCDQVFAEGENEIKRGSYPFMAFLYYPDESVIGPSGVRFIQGAVLVKPDWLITSSVGPMTINEVPLGFPRKTLLARLGAITIDHKFTLSEDEEEQEREVIQIVRPSNQSSTQWWRTDITLLKTLIPFNMTTTVNVGTLHSKSDLKLADCFILIYTRPNSNTHEDRQLMQFFVDIVPPGSQNCGTHFYEDTMLCAVDNIEYIAPLNNSEFCHGNSGGPLVCETDITGLQTYIENNCMQPHLYQKLPAWEDFIICGIEDKCNEEQCANKCIVINKDDDATNNGTTEEQLTTTETKTTLKLTEKITMPSHTNNEVMNYDEVFVTSPATSTTTSAQSLVEESPTSTTTTTTTTPTPATMSEVTVETETPSWPKEKYPQRENTFELDSKDIERKTSVEAQRQKLTKLAGAAHRNMCLFQSLFSICILACLI